MIRFLQRSHVYPTRRASTLIEVMLSMIAGSTVMMIAISVTHQCLQHGSQIQNQTNQTRVLSRLATAFRKAIDNAVHVEVSEERLVAIDSMDVRSEFKFREHRVDFEFSQGETISSREVFDLGKDSHCYAENKNDQRVSLRAIHQIQYGDSGNPNGTRIDVPARTLLHVVAIVGRTKMLGTRKEAEDASEVRP